MTPPWAASAALACAAILALALARLGLRGRLFADAFAIGVTLGATVALALAPFSPNTYPFAVFLAGALQEAVKMVGAVAFLRPHFRARSARDVTLAAGALALGFATLEDLFGLARAGEGRAVLALTSLPMQVTLALAAGYAAARLPRTGLGAAGGVSAWAGLAFVHGLYDVALLSIDGGAGASPPFREAVTGLGLDPGLALRLMLCGAEAMAALAALRALAPADAPEGRRGRSLGSPAFGGLLALALLGGALGVAAAEALASYAFDDADRLGDLGPFVVFPLAFAWLCAPARGALSSRAKRRLAGLALLAACGLAFAAWDRGGAAWRRLDMRREISRGRHLADAHDYTPALAAFGRAAKDAPDNPEPRILRARVYFAERRYQDALAEFDAALSLSPASAPLWAERAETNRRRDRPAAAVADLDAALALAPDDPGLLAARAQARVEAGDTQGALADLMRASGKAPTAPPVQLAFAQFHIDGGDFDAALRDLNARLHDAPGDADALFRRGRVWFYKGEFARAEADFALAKGEGPYLALWRFLARTRLHERGDVALRPNQTPGWPAPVALMLLGEIDAAAAHGKAADDDERCEADFYFAASRLGLDDSSTSAGRLRAALAECPTRLVEYEAAKALLRRLAL